MSWRLHNPTRTLAALGLATVLVGGCVKPNDPGVAIEPLNADIVFGVEEIASREADPVAVQPDPDALATEPEEDLLPAQVFAPLAPRTLPRPPLRGSGAAVVCPDAALNAFPDETAPLEVPADRSPKEGVYRWKRSVKVVRPSEFGPLEADLSGLEERLVRNLTPSSIEDPTDPTRRIYTYEVVQPQIGSTSVAIFTYKVDTNAVAVQAFNPVSDEDPPRAGEPERGVVIKSVRYEDANGNRLGRAFNPTTGLLVLPLGVIAGERYTSTAVDPVTQQTWRLEALVETRDRVDACGEIIEGWRVTGTLTVSGDLGGTRKVSWIVAPHLGGMVIGESVDGAYGDTQVTYNANVGQREPSAPTEQGGT